MATATMLSRSPRWRCRAMRGAGRKEKKKEKGSKKGAAPSSDGATVVSDPAKSSQNKQDWADWERKVDTIGKRDFTVLASEWAAHLPSYTSPGESPPLLFADIDALSGSFSHVGRSGSYLLAGVTARSVVLHEAIYLLHKAVHVQVDVADAVTKGRHTWAYVNGYQGALFALGSVLAFLGLSSERDGTGGGVILIDVWPSEAILKRPSITTSYEELHKLVRFRELDHYQKWALLKKSLRQTAFRKNFVREVAEALDEVKDRAHAKYRNQVNYKSNSWLSADLLVDVPLGPIEAASTFQDHYDAIYAGSANGSIYTLVALVEIACYLLGEIGFDEGKGASGIPLIQNELAALQRRMPTKRVLCGVDWPSLL